MHDGLSGGEPSLLEITDNRSSMEAAARQLQPIPSNYIRVNLCDSCSS